MSIQLHLDIGEIVRAGCKITFNDTGFLFTWPNGFIYQSVEIDLEKAVYKMECHLLDQEYDRLGKCSE